MIMYRLVLSNVRKRKPLLLIVEVDEKAPGSWITKSKDMWYLENFIDLIFYMLMSKRNFVYVPLVWTAEKDIHSQNHV